MRERSTLFGAAMMAAAVVISLAYGLGDGHQLATLTAGVLDQAAETAATAWDMVVQSLRTLL